MTEIYRVVDNTYCMCNFTECKCYDYNLINEFGYIVRQGDNRDELTDVCNIMNRAITPQPKEEQTKIVTPAKTNKHQNVLLQVAKILNADNSASIGFCDGDICHVDINGAEFNLVNIEDQSEFDKVLDAIVLLKKHKLV